MSIPQKLEPNDIVRLIHRYNAGWCLFGIVLLMSAFVFWVVTIYISICCVSSVPLMRFESMKEASAVLFLCGIMGAVLLSPALFFAVRFEADFPALHKTPLWEFVSPAWTMLPPTILCIAPILTVLGFMTLRQCFSYNAKRIALACILYAYLTNWKDWTSYPKFESQRQAVILLYLLGLIRISHRFGKLQIKIVN